MKENVAPIANIPANLGPQNGGLIGAAPAGGNAQSGSEMAALPSGSPVTIDMIQAAPSYQERALLTQNFVKQNPDHAALVVKELLKETGEAEEVDG